MLGGRGGRFFPGRTDPSASRPARSRPAPPPRRAPPRPDPPVLCPGFGLDIYISCKAYPGMGEHGNQLIIILSSRRRPLFVLAAGHWNDACMSLPVESQTRTYHGRDGTRPRTAARRAAGVGRSGARWGASKWDGVAAGRCAQNSGGTMCPGEKRPCCQSRVLKAAVPDDPSEERRKEILCKPNGGPR